jgi:hypothetical protein
LRKELVALSNKEKRFKTKRKDHSKADSNRETSKDYVFFFILNYLPKGLIGYCAVIISAAMSSTSGLNALSFYNCYRYLKRNVKVKNQINIVVSFLHFLWDGNSICLCWNFI